MSDISNRPGLPPLPPADLVARALPLHTLPEGALLYRIHWSDFDPLHFGGSDVAGERYRWDSPDYRYGVCYLGETSHIAFAESYLRERVRAIETVQLEPKSLSTIKVRRPLRLVQFHGSGLAKLGADLSVVAGPYAISETWSAAIHDHPATPPTDGIRYRARHDDDGFAIALFDRARETIVELDRHALLEPILQPILASWLDHYQLGFV